MFIFAFHPNISSFVLVRVSSFYSYLCVILTSVLSLSSWFLFVYNVAFGLRLCCFLCMGCFHFCLYSLVSTNLISSSLMSHSIVTDLSSFLQSFLPPAIFLNSVTPVPFSIDAQYFHSPILTLQVATFLTI